MKKIILSVLIVPLISAASFAQNTNLLPPSGSVGIGTTSPNFLLSLYKNHEPEIQFTSAASGNGNYDGTRVGLGMSDDFFIYNGENTSIIFTTNHIERMHITAGGNIGIGTTSPDSKLTVAGKIHSQEIKVTANAGADFVFDEAYKLRSLNETERFIKKNKHLPDIAPAKDMIKNGIDLGEMNIKLLQKIEELTLYLISQNKDINEVKNTNQRLVDEIAVLKKMIKK